MQSTRGREFELDQAQFDWIRSFAKERAGIHLTEAKYDLVYSRLARRLRALRIEAFAPYVERLVSGDEDEARELINALTTNVTAFFRESHHFDHLAQSAQASSAPLKIWSAACSSGEEPYSAIVTLLEAGHDRFRVLASDLDTTILQRAANGVYDLSKTTGLSQAQLERWFLRGRGARDGRVRVKPVLQSYARFRPINLMQPWGIRGPLDVIFCRNVIIYFDRPTQIGLFHRFADLLRPGGFLYLGHSESVGDEPRLKLVGRTIYERVVP